jgi:hypothetical protein
VYATDASPGADFNPANWFDLVINVPSGGTQTSIELLDFLGTPWSQVGPDYIVIRIAEE